jgi:membrane-associated HD superfamily phosphohydrolase
MSLDHLNLWAILAATVSAFLIGGLWYSPVLFGRAWERANGFSESPQASPKVFAVSFLLMLVMAVNLAMFLNDAKTTAAWGAIAGFLAGFGWAAMGLGVVALFERRSWKYSMINGGYLTVALTLMGLILGAWRK